MHAEFPQVEHTPQSERYQKHSLNLNSMSLVCNAHKDHWYVAFQLWLIGHHIVLSQASC